MTLTDGIARRVPWTADVADARRVVRLFVDDAQWEALSTSSTLTIAGPFKVPLALPLQASDKAFAVAKTCTDQLLRDWGADPKMMIDMSKEDQRVWFTTNDYPPTALRNGEQGVVEIVAEVTSDERARDCRVVAPSRSTALNEATCRIVNARMRFTSNPMPRRYTYQKVSWLLPSS